MNRSDDLFPGTPTPSGTPDDRWTRVFDNASEAPPPRVWDAVERQLDLDDEDGIIPLWQHRQGQQAMLFGRWAAGIAASVLLTLFGWWAWHREDLPTPTATVAVAPKPAQQGVVRQPGTSSMNENAIADANRAAATQTRPNAAAPPLTNVPTHLTERPMVARNVPAPRTQPTATLPTLETLAANVPSQPAEVAPAGDERAVAAVAPPTTYVPDAAARASEPGNVPDVVVQRSEVQITQRSYMTTMVQQQTTMSFVANPAGALAENRPLQPLAIKPMALRPVGNDRIVWVSPQPQAEAEQAVADVASDKQQSRRRKAWLTAGMGASSFDPAMQFRATSLASTAARSFDNSNAYTNAQVAQEIPGSAPVGRALSFQAGVGVPLNDHWAIETGIGYVASQGSVISPTRAVVAGTEAKTVQNQTFYADLIANRLASGQPINIEAYPTQGLAGNAAPGSLSNRQSAYSLANQQAVSNNYQFVQVPAQVSYELRPRRKFGLALLTGFVSNWFVRNTVDQTVEVRVNDGVYRPVTVAGTAGMRFRYRPDRRWSASLAGTFQQNLQSLTKVDVGIHSLPQQVGVSFSVDRHF